MPHNQMQNLKYSLVETLAPSFEPISLAEARDQARVDVDVDDAIISSYITAARVHATDINGRGMAKATYTLTAPRFPSWFVLPRPPLVSVTSIKYLDENGDQQTFSSDNYTVDTASEPGRVFLIPTADWPAHQDVFNAVEVIYISGFTSAAVVPETYKQAMRMLIAHWYEYREPIIVGAAVAKVPIAVDTMLMTDRLYAFGVL